MIAKPPMLKHPASVSTDLVRLLLKYAAENSPRPLAALERLGASHEALTNPGARIPAEQFNALWHAVVLESHDPNFGLHFGTALRAPPDGSILFSVMMSCRSLGDAMDKLARYHGLVTDFVRLRLSRKEAVASYVLETVMPEVALDRQYVEAVFAGQVLTMRHLTANQVQVIGVRFSHPHPQNTSEHERIFRCPLAFDQPRNEFMVKEEDLDLPTFLANPILLERLEGLAQEMLAQVDSKAIWSDQVGRLIGKTLLSGGKPSLNTVAYELAISARHLQNKLRDEGTTYRELLEQLRKETALRHLQDPEASLCEIALLLGFSDQSAFTHAFKRWTGRNPSDFRRSR